MRYIRVSDNGTVLQDMMTSDRLPTPWIFIPKPERTLLNRELYQIRWDENLLRLVEKQEIELSVGAHAWPADGKTPVAICIRGDLMHNKKVHIKINGTGYDVSKDDDVLLTSDEPGQYTITMDDPNYYCAPPTAVVMALTQEDYEAQHGN